MSTILSPSPLQHFDTALGGPASGYKLFTYLAGTTTKTPTYTDASGTTPNTNPVILDSLGNANVWLAAGVAYKYALALPTDSDPPANPIWTVDNITGGAGATSFQGVGATTGSANAQTLSNVNPAYTRLAGNIIYVLWGFTNTGALTLNIGGTGAVSVKKESGGALVPLTGGEAIANSWGIVLDDGVSYELLNPAAIITGADLAGGRLTLTSGTPVTTADVTAATNVYYTPYLHAQIALYDGTASWGVITFAETTLAVPASTSQMYDVFGFNNNGALGLEALAWSNDTTRATALVRQNGVLVKSGATTRRYLGSFRTTGVSGQTEDSLAKRYLWNMTNRVSRAMRVTDTSWTYSTAAFRQANANAANQLDFVRGLNEDVVLCNLAAFWTNSTATIRLAISGIGLDSTAAAQTQALGYATSSFYIGNYPSYSGFPGLGRHILTWLEYGAGADTQTWGGGISVIQGAVYG